MKSFLRQLRFLAVYGTLGILLTLIVGLGLYVVHGPALMPWHLAPLAAEFRAADAAKIKSLEDYRALESRLIAELDAEVYAKVPADERSQINRYSAGSLADARKRVPDWNLSFELPAIKPKGAVLMLHGLTDSPYSMRALAELFAARGWYVVSTGTSCSWAKSHSLASAAYCSCLLATSRDCATIRFSRTSSRASMSLRPRANDERSRDSCSIFRAEVATMAEQLAELERQARALSTDDRARLAEVLLESLQGPPLSEVETAWSREIEERVAAYDRGEAQPYPAEHVFAEGMRTIGHRTRKKPPFKWQRLDAE